MRGTESAPPESGAPSGLSVPGWVTTGSIAGLVLGLALGVVAHETGSEFLLAVAEWVGPLGTLWTNALLMLVIPLIVATLFVALAGQTDTKRGGRRTALAFATFVGLLAVAAAFTLALGTPLLRRLTVDPATVAALHESVAGAAAALEPATAPGLLDWVTTLIPSNPFRAAAEGEMLSIVVAAILFGLAGSRVRPELNRTLVTAARGVAEMCFVLVSWVLRAIPVAAFAVAYAMAAATGVPVAGAIGYYLMVVSGLLLLFTMLLYPITALAGGLRLDRFARGVAPAQAVAVATRSSLASLPPLLECAEQRIGLRRDVSQLVLPLAVSAFKVNRTISAPVKLIFLTHVFGLPLAPEFVVVFVAATILLSFGSPGIPSGGFMISLPFYLAAGIPVEGVVLLRAVDAVPDIFKTLANVTADMTAAAVVDRIDGARAAVAKTEAGPAVAERAPHVPAGAAAVVDVLPEKEPVS